MTGPGASGQPYFCIATFLPVKRWRDLLPMAVLGHRVRNQAANSPGNLARATRANFLRREFRTLSVWRDRDSINAFMRAEPHATAIRRMADWADEGGAFTGWTSERADLDWNEAKRRLQEPTYYYKRPASRQEK